MPQYKYSALSRDGKKVSGLIEGFNELDAAAKIKEIRAKADLSLDTTNLKIPEMVAEIDRMIFGGRGESVFAVNISSFGFKYGIPSEADIMFDVRFLPNPFYIASLKNLTGNNKKVRDYVFRSELAEQFVDSVHSLIKSMIRGYIKEGKYHLNIAFGCTGGHHRSVAIANAVADRFRGDGVRVRVNHRDMELQNKRSK